MTPLLHKAFQTSAAIAGYLIVAASADKVVGVASAATDNLIGAAAPLGADLGKMLDVPMAGIGEVRCGDDVAFGDPLTSDANGKAVKAVPVEGEVVHIIGFAHSDGADDDIIPFHIAPGVLATPDAA